MKIIIFFVMNAFLIKENRDFPLIKDYHSNLQSSLSYFIFFPSFCYIWSSCNKEKNKPLFLMQKMSLKLRVNAALEPTKKVKQNLYCVCVCVCVRACVRACARALSS